MNSALHTAGGLAIVIALILGVAWLLRGAQRFGVHGHGRLRIVASQALSTRERVVVVELAGTWLVLGVAPGQVSRLARMPRPADSAPSGSTSDAAAVGSATAPAPAPGFQGWLERAMHHRASHK